MINYHQNANSPLVIWLYSPMFYKGLSLTFVSLHQYNGDELNTPCSAHSMSLLETWKSVQRPTQDLQGQDGGIMLARKGKVKKTPLM